RVALSSALDRESLRRLVKVDQSTASLGGYAPQRTFQSGMAFASSRAKYIAHQAVRMHANQHRGIAVLNVSANQRHVRFATIDLTLVGNQAELSKMSIDQGLADAMDIAFVRHPVADEFGDGQHIQLVLAAE